jgi:hypothetical protein
VEFDGETVFGSVVVEADVEAVEWEVFEEAAGVSDGFCFDVVFVFEAVDEEVVLIGVEDNVGEIDCGVGAHRDADEL